MKRTVSCWFAILLSGILFCPMVMAQKPGFGAYSPSRERFGNNTLTVQGFPMIFGGYGLEYSRNIFRQQHWLKVSPVLYTASNYANARLATREKLLGFSVGVYHQYNYFELADAGFRMFFQWGANYSYLDLRNVAKAETHIEKFGLDVAIGFRQNIAKPLYFEFYVGYGQRWLTNVTIDNSRVSPEITDTEIVSPRYDSHMFDYGRGGSVLVVGLNVGFLF